jgi:hypothetical protein
VVADGQRCEVQDDGTKNSPSISRASNTLQPSSTTPPS